MMSTDGHAGREELQVIVFDRRGLGDELAAIQPLARRSRWRRSAHGVEFASRLITQISVADHVDQDERANVASVPSFRAAST